MLSLCCRSDYLDLEVPQGVLAAMSSDDDA
jgi:hypothetical protein